MVQAHNLQSKAGEKPIKLVTRTASDERQKKNSDLKPDVRRARIVQLRGPIVGEQEQIKVEEE